MHENTLTFMLHVESFSFIGGKPIQSHCRSLLSVAVTCLKVRSHASLELNWTIHGPCM